MLDESSLNLDLQAMDQFMTFVNNNVELSEFLELVESLLKHIKEFMEKHKNNSLNRLIPFFIKSLIFCFRYSKISDYEGMEVFNRVVELGSLVTQSDSQFNVAIQLISNLTRDEIRKHVQTMNTMIALQLYSENYKSKTISNTVNVMDVFY